MTEPEDKAAEIGRKLGKAFRNAKPRAQQLAAQAKPHVEKALDDAVKFAREHEGEAKHVAQQLVKARVGGPMGMVVDAFASQMKTDAKPAAGQCASCGNANPTTAKFCNQCGSKIEAPPAAQPPASK